MFPAVSRSGRILSEFKEFEDDSADSDDDDVMSLDNEDHSIRLPRRLLRNLTSLGSGTRVMVASGFYRNMMGLLPSSLPGDNRCVAIYRTTYIIYSYFKNKETSSPLGMPEHFCMNPLLILNI